jgi:hypothetical protein
VQLQFASQHAAGLIDLFLRDGEAVDGEPSRFGERSRQHVDHADLDGLGGISRQPEHRTGCNTCDNNRCTDALDDRALHLDLVTVSAAWRKPVR